MPETTRFSITRAFFALFLALAMGFGMVGLSGCTDDNAQSSSAAEQDNCYGDDLPAKK